ncbi:4-aminobutyrate--2-oxoglutarate transaminase [Mycolicibacterium wolinskyi]|uniref:(S)-3-amino-2-methylpropionate transaminase n=1 Tax=Mycolicibacterium wolinskyi TaxID=59750 RepID=A0A1X2F7R0_9MYCO|nr:MULTISPECIES: 4-aminobutyrate--2-oxoglutarate transaminase [Mycolicibacterium]MCV7286850.1 4-aminobutyrate--2-oxoglutarate transaminase [Mycolicibacterium wolinskyi]MCV7293831.1 4-aminobutyrate--2-oxoglutarate transaminase [Mycolicibacterium goodii]ORX14470.1 4-aminobutyrate aminotransferase [Mycolicibacterium wolinskyi]
MTASLVGGPALQQVRRVRTDIPGPRSLELAERRAAALPAGLASAAGVYVAAAGGGVVVDVDDNSFIDLGSGIAVTTVGNAAPAVVSKAAAQLAQYTHTCFLATPYEPYIEVAEALNRHTPGDHEKRTALFNTGSEAVENAVKYARAATGRPAVVVFDHAFHGRSLLTMTMTAKNQPYKHGFGPFAPEVYRAPMAYPYRWPSGPENCAAEAFSQFTQLVDAQLGADAVACVVVEPIQGEGGFIVPAEGFLAKVADFCRDRGILLVADEVQTGIARTGAWFACEHEGLVPDLITTAKGLAGGMPLAAVTGRADIMDAAHAGGIGGTYSGNPVACAAALGVFEEIETGGLIERARAIGDLMVRQLREIAATTDVIGDIRGRGAMIAAELVQPRTREPNREAVAALTRHCQANGVLTLTAGTFGNVLRFLPPLTISDDLLAEAFEVVRDGFANL